MNKFDEHRIQQLLQQALPRADRGAEPSRDLWPAVLRRLAEPAVAQPAALCWLDGALLAGLIAFAILVPASIPVFLYYL